jgi:GAF domain-containing protein
MLNSLLSTWNSITGLEIVFALIGVLMGGVFVLSSWKGSLKGSDLKSDPRIKSLGWAIAGFFATFLGRWEKLLDLDKVDRGRLLLAYTLPLLLTALGAVAAISLMIFVRFAAIRRHNSRQYLSESFGPVLEYLHYGYQRYKEEYEEALEAEKKSRLLRYRELNAAGSSQLALDILAIERYRGEPSEALRANLCRQILDHIRLVVQSYMQVDSTPRLNANIMVAIPVAEATQVDWNLAKFVYQKHDEYGHLLILREYVSPEGQETFALPVVSRTAVKKPKDWVLLGAPDAFLRQEVLVIRTHNLDFAKEMPHPIRQEIQNYFDGKETFRSFACLPVTGAGGPLGIVNVESDQEHIFQESEEVQSEIARVLQPFCALLGLIAR